MKPFKLREIGPAEDFDPRGIYQDALFTQAKFYGDWQANLGRQVKRFLAYRDSEAVAYFQLIQYPLLFGKKYGYIPYGPVVRDSSIDFLLYLKAEL